MFVLTTQSHTHTLKQLQLTFHLMMLDDAERNRGEVDG